MRRSFVLVVPLALVLAACGPGSGSGSESASVAAGDLPAIAGPPPPVPEGAYRASTSKGLGAFTPDELRRRADTAEDRAQLAALKKAGFEHGYEKAWSALGVGGGAAAQVALFLFDDDSGTNDVLGAFRRVYKRSLGVELEQADVSGLGEEGWAGRTAGDDESHIYVWRSGNLVAQVFLGCFQGCDAADGVEDAARAYADAVDGRIDQAG